MLDLPTMKSSIVSKIDTLAMLIVGVVYIPAFYLSFSGRLRATWAYSELFVNWSQGFVRRGLIGSVVIGWHQLTGSNGLELLAMLFMASTVFQIWGLSWLLKHSNATLVTKLMVYFSPALLLFQAWEPYFNYFRKEILILAVLVLHGILARRCQLNLIERDTYRKLTLFLIIPLVVMNCFVHEIQLLLVPVHLLLTTKAISNKSSVLTTLKQEWRFASAYLVTLPMLVLVTLHHGRSDQVAAMYQAVSPWSGVQVAVISSIAWTFGQTSSLSNEILLHPRQWPPYVAAFCLGPLTLLGLLTGARAAGHYLHTLAFAPLLTLFLFGWDFGRWINFIAMSLAIYSLASPSHHRGTSDDRRQLCVLQGVGVSVVLAGYFLAWHVPHCCPGATIFPGGPLVLWRTLAPLL